MIIEYTGRHMTVTVKAETGIARIEKIVGRGASAHIILTEEKYRKIAEVTVKTRGRNLVATCEATEMETALHDALSKVEHQAIKHKQRVTTMRQHPRQLATEAL